MMTETLQSFILTTYCFVLWIGFCHFITSLVLSLCTPIQSPHLSSQSPESPTAQPILSSLVPTVMSIETQEQILNQKGVRELKALASTRKIRGYGKMNKMKLIEVLIHQQQA